MILLAVIVVLQLVSVWCAQVSYCNIMNIKIIFIFEKCEYCVFHCFTQRAALQWRAQLTYLLHQRVFKMRNLYEIFNPQNSNSLINYFCLFIVYVQVLPFDD